MITHRRRHLALVLDWDGINLKVSEAEGQPDGIESQLLHAPHIRGKVLRHAVLAHP